MLESEGIPAGLLIASLLGSMLGLGWHALFGRRLWQLPVYWLGGVIGFLGGVIASGLLGRAFYRLGTVPLVEGTLGALFVLTLLWLFTTPTERPQRWSDGRGTQESERPEGKG